MSTQWWVIVVLLVVLAVLNKLSTWREQQRFVTELRRRWGISWDRDRDMAAIGAYHRSRSAQMDRDVIDDRTWRDLDLDAVFATLDRTVSPIGQQLLYHRLRSWRSRHTLSSFETLIQRAQLAPIEREQAQVALASLRSPAAHDLHTLLSPGAIPSAQWHLAFPCLAVSMLVALAGSYWWHGLFVAVAALLPVCLVVRVTTQRRLARVVAVFRCVGPLVATAVALRCLASADTADITGPLFADVPALGRLRFLSGWLTLDPAALDPLSAAALELANYLFAIDSNALLLADRELRVHAEPLGRVLAAVGDIDAAVAVASFRTGVTSWTQPVFTGPDAQIAIEAMRHPLLPAGVVNDIRLAPPHGSLVTGANMSGKSTLLRALGVSSIMAQTVNTCTAARYEGPTLRVMSLMGRSDSLVEGRSYYQDEVQRVLAIIEASASGERYLFVLDELFRGTNADERIAAAVATLEALRDAATRHVIVAATHDLDLVTLLADFAAFHLSDRIDEHGMVFDYRLVAGPATSRNAIALLRLSGAPPSLVERATALAEQFARAGQA